MGQCYLPSKRKFIFTLIFYFQHELAGSLNINIESLPNLIAYVPSKDIYASLIGTFDEESILNFIDRVMAGKVPMVNIKKETLNFADRKCEEIFEVTESSEDDELLREIIEEERKKREEFEKERRSLEEETKKGKKKKKKKKDL